MEPFKDIGSVKAFQEERTVKDTFLDDGYRRQQQPEIRKRGKERHTQGRRARENCQEHLAWTRNVGGLNKSCYYASVRIIYVAPFYHPPPFFRYTFPVLFKISSIEITITVISGICPYFKMSACRLL